MKREGRQHGMVRTYSFMSAPWNPRPNRGNLNELISPPTAGLFTKVSTKPTNHSKFTGKCGRPMCRGCHDHPACKSKDKVKGAHKIKSSSHVGPDYNLVTWRVVNARPGLKFSGLSATGALDYLAGDDYVDRDYEDDYDEDDGVEIEQSYYHQIEEVGLCDDNNHGFDDDDDDDDNNHGFDDDDDNNNNDDDDDQMSFCEVGFVWQPVDGDESWCLMEEM